jgi:hypothetical protein
MKQKIPVGETNGDVVGVDGVGDSVGWVVGTAVGEQVTSQHKLRHAKFVNNLTCSSVEQQSATVESLHAAPSSPPHDGDDVGDDVEGDIVGE